VDLTGNRSQFHFDDREYIDDSEDWIRDTYGTIQYDPNITKNSVLKKGQTYLGETYRENGAYYRSDGSILFSNENAAYSRIWNNSLRNNIEEMGIITNKEAIKELEN